MYLRYWKEAVDTGFLGMMRESVLRIGLLVTGVDSFVIRQWAGVSTEFDQLWRRYCCLVPSTRSSVPGGDLPVVWVEGAEEDFVDDEENLEDGEVCLKSLKAFASPPSTAEDLGPRFLSAGALVQRPDESQVCDAWIADALLDEGGPNLQLQGASKVLDELLSYHLQRHCDNTIIGLRTFVVKCGSLEDRYTCASYMAAMARGFRPLRELVRFTSIYCTSSYNNDMDGLVLATEQGKAIYQKLASTSFDGSWSVKDQQVASTIHQLLPDDETTRRCTHSRFVSPEK